MYVVKVGEYYVKNIERHGTRYVWSITLSKEIMGTFSKTMANFIAKETNGKAIKMAEETTCE